MNNHRESENIGLYPGPMRCNRRGEIPQLPTIVDLTWHRAVSWTNVKGASVYWNRRPNWRFAFIAAAAVLLVALWITWHKQIRHQVFPKNFGIVQQGSIYRSGQLTPRTLRQVIEQHGIRTVVALNPKDPESEDEQRVCAEMGVDRHEYPMRGDGTGDPSIVAKAVSVMLDETSHPVLVHCAAGAQRTTTVVLLYEHFRDQRSFFQSYPESFEFKHDPHEWKVLAWIAQNLDEVEAQLWYEAFSELEYQDADPADDDRW